VLPRSLSVNGRLVAGRAVVVKTRRRRRRGANCGVLSASGVKVRGRVRAFVLWRCTAVIDTWFLRRRRRKGGGEHDGGEREWSEERRAGGEVGSWRGKRGAGRGGGGGGEEGWGGGGGDGREQGSFAPYDSLGDPFPPPPPPRPTYAGTPKALCFPARPSSLQLCPASPAPTPLSLPLLLD